MARETLLPEDSENSSFTLVPLAGLLRESATPPQFFPQPHICTNPSYSGTKTTPSFKAGFTGPASNHFHNENRNPSSPTPMRHRVFAGNVHDNHTPRLSLVMSDNGFSSKQRDIVMTVLQLWGQHMADILVSYYNKVNTREEVI